MSAYITRHERVYRARGRAKEHCCVNCGEEAQEWAQIHGTDGESPENYQPMCCSCHQSYDDHWDEATRAKVAKSVERSWAASPSRRQFSEQHRQRMREAWSRRKARKEGMPICDT